MTHEGGFGVYVHWPYCARICPYCDFNVHRPRGADFDALIAAIAADLAAHRARMGPRRAQTVFLGGGTPSLLSGAQVGTLLAAVDRAFPLTADVEISLEANPEDSPRFADHVRAGVSRLSLGVQALRDADLAALGRTHSAVSAVAAVEAAAKTGARVSVDLIYARHGQSLPAWEAELAEALALPAEHLSLYQLTIEAGTAFARAAARGQVVVPAPDRAADFYEATQALCDAAGVPAYEVSNHARAPAAQARHNLVYWRVGEWVGVGPGAHGRVVLEGARTATVALRRPADYVAAVVDAGLGWDAAEPLAPDAIAEEFLLFGLRLAEGLDLARAARLGLRLSASRMKVLTAQGFVEPNPDRLILSPAGRLVADRIGADLLLG